MLERISAETGLIALLGNPAKHSISPKMHNFAFKQLGLDYVYLAFEVKEDQLYESVQGLKSLGAIGFNVTMPYKESVIPFLDDVTEEAKLCEAVNTVKNDHGRLIGYNTDGMGFVMALNEEGVKIQGKKFSVIGAGGAAKSIVIRLAMEGASAITLFNRSQASANHLVQVIRDNIPDCRINWSEIDMAKMKTACRESEALINTTNVGMGELINKSVVTDSGVFHKGLLVADIIYSPPKTRLLEEAEKSGCRIMNGLGMIVGQGALAFHIWTGKEMPIALVKEAVIRN